MKKIISFLIVIISLTILAQAGLVLAQNDTTKTDDCHGLAGSIGDCVALENPLGEGRVDVRLVFGDIINYALGLLGSVVLGVFIFGGFTWLTSAGNSEKVKKGLNTMLWAGVGVFIIFSSYAILNTVTKGITSPMRGAESAIQDQGEGGSLEFNCFCKAEGEGEYKPVSNLGQKITTESGCKALLEIDYTPYEDCRWSIPR